MKNKDKLKNWLVKKILNLASSHFVVIHISQADFENMIENDLIVKDNDFDIHIKYRSMLKHQAFDLIKGANDFHDFADVALSKAKFQSNVEQKMNYKK